MGWTLADGGHRARERERGGLEAAAARGRLALESREAGLRAAELSLQLLRLREVELAQEQATKWLDGLGVLVRAGVASGARSSADSIRVALERDDEETGLEGTRLATRTATLEILALLGRNPDAPLHLREPPATAEDGPSEADSVRLIAGVERLPEIALARVAEAETRLDLADARQGAAPTVELSLDAGLAGADLTSAVPADLKAANPDASFSDRLRRDLGASAAVRLRWPLRSPTVLPAVRARQAEKDAMLGSKALAAQGFIQAAEQFESALSRNPRFAEAHEELSEIRFRFLNECVALLSPAAQSLLEARYQQRRPIDDLAKMLSKTVSAVSVQLFAIRQKLRECIEKKWRSHVAANS